MSAVRLDDREDNGKEVDEERQDRLGALAAFRVECEFPDKTYDDLIVNEMGAASVMLVEKMGQDASVDGRRGKHYEIAQPQQGPRDDICQSRVVVAVPVHGEFFGDCV